MLKLLIKSNVAKQMPTVGKHESVPCSHQFDERRIMLRNNKIKKKQCLKIQTKSSYSTKHKGHFPSLICVLIQRLAGSGQVSLRHNERPR